MENVAIYRAYKDEINSMMGKMSKWIGLNNYSALTYGLGVIPERMWAILIATAGSVCNANAVIVEKYHDA